MSNSNPQRNQELYDRYLLRYDRLKASDNLVDPLSQRRQNGGKLEKRILSIAHRLHGLDGRRGHVESLVASPARSHLHNGLAITGRLWRRGIEPRAIGLGGVCVCAVHNLCRPKKNPANPISRD